MQESSAENQPNTSVRYELSITADEANTGGTKTLTRNGKKLELTLPAGISTGKTIKLTNALQLTDKRPGDILVKIRVKSQPQKEEAATGVLRVSDTSFENEVLKSELPVLVDFWAAWCAPCRQISPIIDKLAEEYAGHIKFCALNVDENPLAAGKFQVQSIPLLLFFKGGKVIEQIRGAVPEAVIRSKLEAIVN